MGNLFHLIITPNTVTKHSMQSANVYSHNQKPQQQTVLSAFSSVISYGKKARRRTGRTHADGFFLAKGMIQEANETNRAES